METLMDYLDMLEDLLENSNRTGLFGKASIDKNKFYEVIGDIRLSIPSEIQHAQKIIADHQKWVDDAKSKAAAIIQQATLDAQALIADHEIIRHAEVRDMQSDEEAKKFARSMQIGAYNYADKMLSETEVLVRQALDNVTNSHRMALDNVTNSYRMAESDLSKTLDELYNGRQQLKEGRDGLS